MSVILPIIYTILFIFLIYRLNFFDVFPVSRNVLAAVFIIKIIAGTILWWLYTYRFPGADLLDYFNDGNVLFHLLFQNPKLFFQIIFHSASYAELHSWNDSFEHVLYNDSHTMIILNTLFHFFSFGNFHVHTVFMCFLSLTGLTAIYKVMLPYFLDGKKILFVMIFFIPSVIFWSSGVLKEGLLFFGLGMFLYATNCGLTRSYTWKKIVVILISMIILLLVKVYVLLALLPGLLLNAWISRTSPRSLLVKYMMIIIVFVSGVLFLSAIHSDYDPLKIISEKQAKAISEAKGGIFLVNDQHFICVNYEKKAEELQPLADSLYRIKPGSTYLQWDLENMADTSFIINSTDTSKFNIMYEVIPAKTILKLNPLQATVSSVMINAPAAFLRVLIQPLIWKVKGFIQLLPALENIFLIGLLLMTIIFFNRETENIALIIFCLSFVFILFILIGITTPAVGTIIRYKVPALPFLAIALLCLMDRKKIAKKFPFIAKWLE